MQWMFLIDFCALNINLRIVSYILLCFYLDHSRNCYIIRKLVFNLEKKEEKKGFKGFKSIQMLTTDYGNVA